MSLRVIALLLVSGAACGGTQLAVPDTASTTGGGEVTGEVPVAGLDVATPAPDAVEVADVAADVGSEPDAEAPEDVLPPEPGFVYTCAPLEVQACVTACLSVGKKKCLKDWGPCVPPQEFCGNCADDDCDGQVNEDCAPNPPCGVVTPAECPVGVIAVEEGISVDVGVTLHLSSAGSVAPEGSTIASVKWEATAPDGSTSTFAPSATAASATFVCDVAGQYLFTLTVVDSKGTAGCAPAQVVVLALPSPPIAPSIGCADGAREGFVDVATYPQIAACSGAWAQPGLTPDGVAPTCGRAGGDDGAKPEGAGCSSADLCAEGWHVCKTWKEVAQKSPTGCAGATPPDAKPKSLLFALRQPSKTGSVCGEWGDGFNDVFGCGNLGTGLGADKGCGPLDRVIASTQPDKCGFNEAEPPLGPWECKGGPGSDLLEGQTVTKKACAGKSCSYDGVPLGSADKGGVLCCHD